MKRDTVIALIFLTILMMLGGCSPPPDVSVEMIDLPPSQHEEEGESGESDQLTLSSSLWVSPEEQAFFIDEIITPFEREFDVKVNYQVFDERTLFERAVIQQSSEKTMTDVIITAMSIMDNWIENRYASDLTPLTSVFTDRKFVTGFNDIVLQESTQLFLPLSASTYVMVVNNNAYRYLPPNLSLNQMDWVDFAAWVNAASRAQGRGILCLAGAPGKDITPLIASSILSYGGGLPDVDSNQAANAWSLWISMQEAISPQSLELASCAEPMVNNEVWLSLMDQRAAETVFAETPDRFTTLPLPAGPAGLRIVGEMGGIAIVENAPNPRLAGSFLEFITRGENVLKLNYLSEFTLPTLTDMNPLLTLSPRDRIIRVGLLSMRQGTVVGVPEMNPDSWDAIMAIYEQIFTEMVIDGDGFIDDELLTASGLMIADILD